MSSAEITLFSRDGGAVFGPEGLASPYRYRLWRDLPHAVEPCAHDQLTLGCPSCRYDARKSVAFIMLNPSTATHEQLDPTIRRCIGFAQRWGYARMEIGNIFAFRATDPRDLRKAAAPIGPANDVHLNGILMQCDRVICAWGAHGEYQGRGEAVAKFLRSVSPIHALKLTNGGHPGHPLYLRADLEPVLWEAA